MMKMAIFTEDLYEDVEFWYPFYRLKEAGHRPVVIGSGKKNGFKGKHGIEQQGGPVHQGRQVRGLRCGHRSGRLRSRPHAPGARVRRVRQAACSTEGKLVASICHGPWVLASAGILKGKKVTCWPIAQGRHDERRALDTWTRRSIVDGNIITSRCPDDLPAFMAEVLRYPGCERIGTGNGRLASRPGR